VANENYMQITRILNVKKLTKSSNLTIAIILLTCFERNFVVAAEIII